MKIKITADSTCDLSPQQIHDNNITIIPLIVNKAGQSYLDGIDILPKDIFAHVAGGGDLCSTSAVPIGGYQEHFEKNLAGYDALIHISIGSGFSASYQNASLAAEELENVYVVDSKNLSTGQGLLVLAACELAKTEADPAVICKKLAELTDRIDASFLLERLDYMVKGGRCSAVKALGANLLKLKPCIQVDNNKLVEGKRYRGTYAKCMEKYVRDRLEDIDNVETDLIFTTHTPVDDAVVELVKKTVQECGPFREIVETTAGCTISCHCGEGTFGILFIRKK